MMMSVKEMIVERFLDTWKRLARELDDEACTESRIVIAKGKENGRRYQVCLQIIMDEDDFLSEGYGEVDVSKEIKRANKREKKS